MIKSWQEHYIFGGEKKEVFPFFSPFALPHFTPLTLFPFHITNHNIYTRLIVVTRAGGGGDFLFKRDKGYGLRVGKNIIKTKAHRTYETIIIKYPSSFSALQNGNETAAEISYDNFLAT